MNCCSNCFWDVELTTIIGTNSIERGNCDFCDTQNTDLLNPVELADSFQTLLDVYFPASDVGIDDSEGLPLFERIQKDWKIFRIENPEKGRELLNTICGSEREQNPSLFDQPVVAECLYNPMNTEQAAIQELNWENFRNEIRTENRFFLNNSINIELLTKLFSRHERSYRRGKIFYRGRVADATGFSATEIGRPPEGQAKGGRANPNGISYLYLASDLTTTFYEVRAGVYDYVTIGEFKVENDLTVVSLRELHEVSPFQLDDEVADYMVHKRYLRKLGSELSKPLRRQDTALDYLPTQYLCELIKHLGYDGVEYGSSQNPDGFNLAFFYDDSFTCISATNYEIKSIDFNHAPVNPS